VAAAQLFISYSRRDRDFVERLNAALIAAGRDAYVDWEDIPAWSPDYERELMQAIDGCDAFVFVLSADSLASPNCRVELERAVAQGKRIRPLLRRKVDAAGVPEALARPQWIDFSGEDRFQEAFATLVESVDVDADWVRQHTRIGVRATEWESRSRESSFLLRGRDLRDAETWLAGREGKEPPPTQLQSEYVAASRRGTTRRQRITLGAVLVALVAALVLAAVAVLQRNAAISQRNEAVSLALASAANGQSSSDVDLALRLSLEGNRVKPTTQAIGSMLSALVTARRSGATTILRAHQGSVASVAFSPDGHLLASGGGGIQERDGVPAGDGSLRLWNVDTLRPVGSRLTGRHLRSGEGVAFSRDGHTLAGVSLGGEVQLWDLRTPRRPVARLESHRGFGWGIAFSADGHTVAASVGQDGTVELWDVRHPTKPGLRLTDKRLGLVWAVAFSPDGRTLAAAGDGRIRLWDVRHPSRAGRVLRAGTDNVWAVAFSPDGHTLASATDGGIQLWLLRGRREAARSLFGRGTVYSLAFSPDGRTLVAAGGGVWIFNLRRPAQPAQLLGGHEGPVLAVAFSPDGHTFASGGADGTVRVWDTRTRRPIVQPLKGSGNVGSDGGAFSRDGNLFALAARSTSNERATVRLWDVRRPAQRPRIVDRNRELIDAIAFTQNGQTLAYGGYDGIIRLWDVGKSRHQRRLPGPAGALTALAFSPDGHTLASATAESITLFDLRRRQARGATLQADQRRVNDLAFSPDGHTLASAGLDGSVALWDIEKQGRLARRVHVDDSQLNVVAFSEDGHTLAAGGVAGVVRLWDVRKHTQLGLPLDGDHGVINDIAFAADGRTLVTAGSTGLRLWHLPTHRQIGPSLNGGHGAVIAVAISPDGHTLASGTDFGELVIHQGILWRDFADLKATVCRLAPVDLGKREWDKLAPGMPNKSKCLAQGG
jgi:WD40 repeat protein